MPSNPATILDASPNKAPGNKITPTTAAACNLARALRDNLSGVTSQASRLNEIITNGGADTTVDMVAALFGGNVGAVKDLIKALVTINISVPPAPQEAPASPAETTK